VSLALDFNFSVSVYSGSPVKDSLVFSYEALIFSLAFSTIPLSYPEAPLASSIPLLIPPETFSPAYFPFFSTSLDSFPSHLF